jgi:mono/diheme cytochrome c family protein
MNQRLILLCGLTLLWSASDLCGEETQVRAFLSKHCLACHGAGQPKGNVRLDTLRAELDDRPTREHWLAVAKRVKAGEMPPEGKPQPTAVEVKQLLDWISKNAADAENTPGPHGPAPPEPA